MPKISDDSLFASGSPITRQPYPGREIKPQGHTFYSHDGATYAVMGRS